MPNNAQYTSVPVGPIAYTINSGDAVTTVSRVLDRELLDSCNALLSESSGRSNFFESESISYTSAPTFTATQSEVRSRIDIKLDPESFSDEQKKTLKHNGWVSPEEFETFKAKYGLDKIT